MAYGVVGDVIGQARTLLQDAEVGNFRWPDENLYQALNEGLLMTKRLRPDFFWGLTATPQYAITDANVAISYPEEYIPAIIDYVVGNIQAQDDEATDDARASLFLRSFTAKLTTTVA